MKSGVKVFILLFTFSALFLSTELGANTFNLPKPAILFVTPNDTICQGETVKLKLSVPTGNLLWNTGAVVDSILVAPTSTSSYYVINDYGGSSQDTLFVTITVFQSAKPLVSLTPTDFVCKGDSVFLTLTNPLNSILWSTNETSPSIFFIADTISNFFVINDAGGNCPDTASIYVQIKSKNYTIIDIHGGGCPGTDVNINVVNPRGTVVWNTGSNLPYLNINPDTTTTYTLINNAYTKCSDTLKIEIYVPLKIKPVISIFPNDSICEGDNLKIEILNPYKKFYWSNGSSDTVQFTQANINTPLWVINDNNGACPDTTFLNVNVIDIDSEISVPNCFSPNGDGVNDIFKISEAIKSDYSFTIYNRWGQKMFESGDSGFRDWNGTFLGEGVDEGNYFWILNFQSYCGGKLRTKRGFVSVFR